MNIILGDAFQKDAGTTGTIDYEIRILLDNIDYTEDVVQEEYKRHADKVFSDGLFRFECSEKSGEKVENPWRIPNPPRLLSCPRKMHRWTKRFCLLQSLLKRFFSDFCEVLVLILGTSVRNIEIHEVREERVNG